MYGVQTAAKWIVILTANLSLNCGLKVDASDEQLHFTAIAIANKYKKLKASEIMLFFFNFKAGFYERFYGYFDTQTIIRSFELFLQERHKIIQRYEALIEEIRNKKGKRPGLSLEEINQNYFKTETLNKLLHKTF